MKLDQGATRQPAVRFDGRWVLFICVILVAGRWNAMVYPRALNPDEGVVIAGAITLRHDPLFWRSVFGLTTGPLDFYILWPIGSLFGDTFFAARLTGTLLIGASLVLLHQTVARHYGLRIARLSTLSPLCFESFTAGMDFLHYSTELLPLFLLSAAVYFAFSLRQNPGGALWRYGAVGAFLGAVPFAKLQAAPIALTLGVISMIWLWRERRRASGYAPLGWLLGGALLPLTVFGVMLLCTPDKEGAVISFLLANVAYADRGGTLLETVAKMGWRFTAVGLLLPGWLVGSLITMLAARLLSVRAPGESRSSVFWVGVLTLVLALGCMVAPRRPFPHYAQLLVLPVTLLVGSIAGSAHARLRQSVQKRKAGWLTLSLLSALALMLADFDPQMRIRSFPGSGRPQGVLTVISKVARPYIDPEETLAVWGLPAHFYVELGARQAARHATTELEIMPNPYAEAFRSRYLADLRASRPPVFIDASFVPVIYPVRKMAHEISFPELGTFVGGNYSLVSTVDETRIYVRKDRLIQRSETGALR